MINCTITCAGLLNHNTSLEFLECGTDIREYIGYMVKLNQDYQVISYVIFVVLGVVRRVMVVFVGPYECHVHPLSKVAV